MDADDFEMDAMRNLVPSYEGDEAGMHMDYVDFENRAWIIPTLAEYVEFIQGRTLYMSMPHEAYEISRRVVAFDTWLPSHVKTRFEMFTVPLKSPLISTNLIKDLLKNEYVNDRLIILLFTHCEEEEGVMNQNDDREKEAFARRICSLSVPPNLPWVTLNEFKRRRERLMLNSGGGPQMSPSSYHQTVSVYAGVRRPRSNSTAESEFDALFQHTVKSTGDVGPALNWIRGHTHEECVRSNMIRFLDTAVHRMPNTRVYGLWSTTLTSNLCMRETFIQILKAVNARSSSQ